MNCRKPTFPCLLATILISILLFSCKQRATDKKLTAADSAALEEQRHLPENALKELEISDGLVVEAMATEPMIKNPTNIDVDERGRVWVTEAYNYRPGINGNPTNPEGDRIMILEDSNSDGKFEKAKVFYQGPEINAPLGICVLGKQVIVSQSPYVWSFYDDNGDDKADRKEILFQGIGGEQHDHGVHSFTFGPDGKLYFNFGNEGKTLKDKNGRVVRDQDGDEIDSRKYKMGMVFRCDPDGSNVECLAQNFRNNYEAAVDSYGILWQSDNDDDGNRSVRINYVMDYGNYGYTDEMTGAGWSASRTNMEDSIPFRHWHQNDPGVVPNLLLTGAGSPTGMVIYEGDLLPAGFHDQMIHSDAGPNVVRSYPVKKSGAGYTASIVNILRNEKDQWFRPADVCVAPDGSLIIADWYDPGVGGHQAGDQQRGRIYRVAPKGSRYSIPKQDYNTPAGAVAALQNPNLAVRHHAFTALQKMGPDAVPELEKLWFSGSNPRMRARAFWVLFKMPGDRSKYIEEGLRDANPDIRILTLRAARETKTDLAKILQQLVNDREPQVRREAALALHNYHADSAAYLWASLAKQYDGKDRWYLEALGIGANNQWDKFFPAYVNTNPDQQSAAFHDLVWRARTDSAVQMLAALAADAGTDLSARLRYFRAFDFNKGPAKYPLLLKMIETNSGNDTRFNKLVLRHLDLKSVNSSPIAKKALDDVLKSVNGTGEYIELVDRYTVKRENPVLLQLAIDKPDEPVGRDAAGLLLKLGGQDLAQQVLNGNDSSKITNLLRAISRAGKKESIDMLQRVALSTSYSMNIRKTAASMIGRSWDGEDRALDLLKKKKVPKELIPDVVQGTSGAWRRYIYDEATSYLPGGKKQLVNSKVPELKELLALPADVSRGKQVFSKICAVCHQVGTTGFDFGPKLTEIGSKLPKESQFEAIVHPSAGISFGFEGSELKMKDGSTMTGIVTSKTETDIDLKIIGGSVQKVKTWNVQSVNKLDQSLMPERLHEQVTSQELADLLEYLSSLKKK
ncbi:MAG TPA: PVC-type heme-binding CxxCH protein [Flavitalea sp.]|nr:PVC-type heme-binding CxxCH protein [Flavitalea sp.]